MAWRWLGAWSAWAALGGQTRADNAVYAIGLNGVQAGTAYTMLVTVGTSEKKKKFRLIADTGSSNDAILGSQCCDGKAKTTFSCEQSSTCQKSDTALSLEFAGATISGKVVTDKWIMGDVLSIDKEFLVIDQESGFFRMDYDGITGLGYKALAQPANAPQVSFYDRIIQGAGCSDAFGLLLCGVLQPRLNDSKSLNWKSGLMTIGGIDGPDGTKYFNDPILYTPIVEQTWYNVLVTDIAFDGQSLDFSCSTYNNPQVTIDSGTSNIALPSQVYNALVEKMKAKTAEAMPSFNTSLLDFRTSCCEKKYCDITDPAADLLKLPPVTITLALQTESSDPTDKVFTIEIPPQYYWRPEMNGEKLNFPCRAFGFTEGTGIVLGDVFLDGLFTYHDRENQRMGFAVASNCPNDAVSSKKVTKSDKTIDWCKCLSSHQREKSNLVTFKPWGTGCFFWLWWMYVVIACGGVIVICVGVVISWFIKGRMGRRATRFSNFSQEEKFMYDDVLETVPTGSMDDEIDDTLYQSERSSGFSSMGQFHENRATSEGFQLYDANGKPSVNYLQSVVMSDGVSELSELDDDVMSVTSSQLDESFISTIEPKIRPPQGHYAASNGTYSVNGSPREFSVISDESSIAFMSPARSSYSSFDDRKKSR